MKLPKHIRYWDDERGIGNGILVTLTGRCFEPYDVGGDGCPRHVQGFETVTEARAGSSIKATFPCLCSLCVGLAR